MEEAKQRMLFRMPSQKKAFSEGVSSYCSSNKNIGTTTTYRLGEEEKNALLSSLPLSAKVHEITAAFILLLKSILQRKYFRTYFVMA